MIKILTATLIAFFGLSANADDFEVEASRTIELTNSFEPTIKSIENMLQTMSPMMINQIYQEYSDQGKEIPRSEVSEFVNEWRARFVERSRIQLRPVLIEGYRKFLSLEEIKELNQLLESPIFQRYAAKTPELMAAIEASAGRVGERLGLEIMQELKAENPKFN